MTRLWLAVLVVCGGLEVACSSVGPLVDGVGGTAGLPTGGWDPGGASGGAGRPTRPGGSGGVGGSAVGGGRPTNPGGSGGGNGVAGTGGFSSQGAANELSCLEALFAACPTAGGLCGFNVGLQGTGGRAAPSGTWGSGGTIGGTYCFETGVTVVSATQSAPCASPAAWDSVAYDTEWAVYKPDGSVCYTISRYRECSHESEVLTVRDGSGAVVGSGSRSVVSASGSSFTCVDGGDSCRGSDSCIPTVPLGSCTAGTCR